MRVRVEIIIDIEDPGEWTAAFGVAGETKIRKDVKSYVGNEVQSAGVFGNGEVTAEITWS